MTQPWPPMDPGNSPPENWTEELSPEELQDIEIMLTALAGLDE